MFISRGRFTVLRNAHRKQDSVKGGAGALAGANKSKREFVAKLSQMNYAKEAESLREFEALKNIRQQNIARLHEAFIHDQVRTRDVMI